MRIHQPKCPTCGEWAIGTVERLTGRAEFQPLGDDGTTEYSGWTEIWWDEQRTRHQNDDRPASATNLPLVCCVHGHAWATAIDR